MYIWLVVVVCYVFLGRVCVCVVMFQRTFTTWSLLLLLFLLFLRFSAAAVVSLSITMCS